LKLGEGSSCHLPARHAQLSCMEESVLRHIVEPAEPWSLVSSSAGRRREASDATDASDGSIIEFSWPPIQPRSRDDQTPSQKPFGPK
jgi:hypothetical protein